MNSREIVAELSSTHQPRATLYLNGERVDALFSQELGAVREIVLSEKLGAKISASLLKLLDLELGGDKEQTVSGTLDSILKAILLERAARESNRLRDLRIDDPRAGQMLFYCGDGRIIDVDESLGQSLATLPAESLAALDTERIRQQKRLQRRDPELGTIVWLATEPQPLASIASEKWVDAGLLSSYGGNPPFGILGRFERELSGIALLSPLWIWRDGW
jgi:hypothetical protein